MVLLGIYAGLRITAEVLTLKVANVDIRRKQLTIEAAYSKNREPQAIPLHSKLVTPLENRIRESRPGLVFENREGKALHSVQGRVSNSASPNLEEKGSKGRWKEPKMILRYATPFT